MFLLSETDSGPEGIRTPNLLGANEALYRVELLAHVVPIRLIAPRTHDYEADRSPRKQVSSIWEPVRTGSLYSFSL